MSDIYKIIFTEESLGCLNRLLGIDLKREDTLKWDHFRLYATLELSESDILLLRLGMPEDAISHLLTLSEFTYNKHNTD
jgi:hypothetical protein